jgi:serine/threonine protein phosphatase PrpC
VRRAGHIVARMAAEKLTQELNRLPPDEPDLEGRLWDAFTHAHEHVTSSSRCDAALSGATLTLSVLRGSKLITAWVGDSRAVLARRIGGGKVAAYDLTVDHKPTLPAEHQRIIAAGGRVQQLVVRCSDSAGDCWCTYYRCCISGANSATEARVPHCCCRRAADAHRT